MFAKVAILFTVLAAVQAIGHLGYGAPYLGAAPYGVSIQKTAISHVAPAYAAPLAYGHGLAAGHLGYGLGAPLAYGHGLAAAPLAYGHGLAGAPLAYGHGVLGARYGGILGLGHGVGLGKALL